MISVIVPCLNDPTIQETLESLYQQQCIKLIREIIVIGQDKGEYIRPHSLLRFIYTPTPLSPAAARNLGANQIFIIRNYKSSSNSYLGLTKPNISTN